MRYLFIALFTATCTLSAAQNLQTNATDAFMLRNDSSATLSGWFERIERQGIVLAYNSSDLNLKEMLTVKKQTTTVDALLQQLLAAYDFEVQHVGAHKILLKIKGTKIIPLLGMVTDKDNHESIPGCSFTLTREDGMIRKLVTDAEGKFRELLPPGNYQVRLSRMGYRSLRRTLALHEATTLRLELDPLETPLKEVTVSPSPFVDEVNHKGARHQLSLDDNDPMSQITGMPGIAGTYGTGNFHVNGGQSDENLVLMDGISVFHFHHNNSLLAQFNGAAVKKVAFYDSFIPAEYEGRLSSVTDVKIKEGDSVNHHQTFALTLPATALTFEGPIVKNKLTYVLSGRHSWIDFMEDLFANHPKATRTFKDMLGKVSYHISPRTSLHALVYRSRDQYNDSVDQQQVKNILEWGNSLYALTLNTRPTAKVSNTNTLAYTTYFNRIYAPMIDIDTPIYIDEGINKISFKSDFTTRLDPHVQLAWGLNFSQEKFNLIASKDTLENNDQHVSQFSTYVNSNLSFSEHFDGSVALNFVGYFPHHHTGSFSIQPRFSLRYLPNPRHTFSLSFSRMEQFYHNICLGEIPLPTDLRMPSIDGFKPSSSLHVETAWKHTRTHWSSTLSTFYKRRYHILGVRYNIDPSQVGWHQFIMEGNAASYGLKFHALGVWPHWLLDLSYTFSRSHEWFDDYKQGKKVPTLHDLPHIFNYALSFRWKKRSFLTLGGYIKSGTNQPIFDFVSSSDSFVNNRKRDRFNHRLDFNYSSAVSTKNKRMTFSYKVGLYNIIGHPKENEVIDLYSKEIHQHCLPYFTMKLEF